MNISLVSAKSSLLLCALCPSLQQADAAKIRHATARALHLLSGLDPTSGSPLTGSDDPEIELDLTFEQYDLLYHAGLITHEQIRKGSVKERDYDVIHRFLADETRIEQEIANKMAAADTNDVSSRLVVTSEFPEVLDCGLKRVDSKRYSKDFIVNRGTPQMKRRVWKVKAASAEGTEVIKATPAGERERVDPDDTRQVRTRGRGRGGILL